MRVAVLSDIHANLRALDAILEQAGPVDAIWHLGDVVGYGPDPDAVVARLRERGALGVRGNHDLAATGSEVIEEFNQDARAAMEWTRRVILPETREWLAGLPERLTIGAFSLVHGSQRDPTWEYIVAASVAAANLAICPTEWGLFGHTHLPWAWLARDGTDGRPADQGRVEAREPAAGDLIRLGRSPGPAQPRQRRPAARRQSRCERPGPRHGAGRGRLGPGPLRRRGDPAGDACRRAARPGHRPDRTGLLR